ncbi:MAG: RAD55 family ATPase [Candidatus Methanospirareceae archaeon]
MEEIERIKTYIERLDERLEGGIPKGTISLICGTTGSMKTSLAYSILYKNAVENNLKGMYITLEQSVKSLKKQMKKMGMEEENENLIVVDRRGIIEELGESRILREDINWIRRIKNYIEDKLREEHYDLLAIDPLNPLYSLVTIENPRGELYLFFESLRETGLTSFLISEMERGESRFSKYGIAEFLSDAIIHLDLRRENDMLERYLGVIKMRFTNHGLQYFPLFYNNGRFVIYTKEELEL